MLNHSLLLVTPATSDPVTVAEAKTFLRIDHDSEDDALDRQISVAASWCQERIDRQFMLATYRMYLDRFPTCAIILRRPPLKTLSSITYVDGDGVTQPLAANQYKVSNGRSPVVIWPAYECYWPTARTEQESVQVNFIAGYDTAADVPAGIREAICLHLGILRGDYPQLGLMEDECRNRRDELLMQHWHGYTFQ
jgi:uncharacterized phiE125 gp8 family phage protein